MYTLSLEAQKLLKAGSKRGFNIAAPQDKPGFIRTADENFPAETHQLLLDDLCTKGLVAMKTSTFYMLTTEGENLAKELQAEA